MDALSPELIDQLAQDIAFVKKAIEKNSSILNRIDFRGSLRLTVLLSAISVFVFCGLFHILMKHFGGFAAIPVYLKAIVFSAIALDFTLLGILKNFGVLRSARAFDPGISLFRLMREYYSIRIYHHFIPLACVLVFACVYASMSGHAAYIVPLLAIGAGLIYNAYDILLRVDEFLFTGYWFIVSGCILLVFHTVSPLLSISISLGCGCLLLSVIWYLPQRRRTEA